MRKKKKERKWKNKSGHLKKKASKLKYFEHNAHLKGYSMFHSPDSPFHSEQMNFHGIQND